MDIRPKYRQQTLRYAFGLSKVKMIFYNGEFDPGSG